jgi:hypothetical protein
MEFLRSLEVLGGASLQIRPKQQEKRLNLRTLNPILVLPTQYVRGKYR